MANIDGKEWVDWFNRNYPSIAKKMELDFSADATHIVNEIPGISKPAEFKAAFVRRNLTTMYSILREFIEPIGKENVNTGKGSE